MGGIHGKEVLSLVSMVLAQPYDGRGARAHLGVYGMDVTLRNSIRNSIVSMAAIYLIVTAGMAISSFFSTQPLPYLHHIPAWDNPYFNQIWLSADDFGIRTQWPSYSICIVDEFNGKDYIEYSCDKIRGSIYWNRKDQ